MEIVNERCAGLDVHKRTVVACVRTARSQETRTFGTTTEALQDLVGWLAAEQVTHVVMESTGVFWQPIVRHEALCDREGMKGPLLRAVAAAR